MTTKTIGCVQHDCAECKVREDAQSTSLNKQVLEKFDELDAPSTSPTDDEMLAAFNSCEKVIDGLHAVFQLATPSTSSVDHDNGPQTATEEDLAIYKSIAVEYHAAHVKRDAESTIPTRLTVKQRVDIADACARLDWDNDYINCIANVVDLVEAAHNIK